MIRSLRRVLGAAGAAALASASFTCAAFADNSAATAESHPALTLLLAFLVVAVTVAGAVLLLARLRRR